MNDSPYKILVALDRDNTINLDPDTYFGRDEDWKDNVKFCHGAIDGLITLTQHPNIVTIVVTAQLGVAKGVMTAQRVEEVNAYLDDQLRKVGVKIDSWQYSPYCVIDTATRWEEKGVTTINYDYVVPKNDERSAHIKPANGLLVKAASELQLELDDLPLYVVGDRASDLMTGVNNGGVGILVDNPHITRSSSKFDEIEEIKELVKDHFFEDRAHIVSCLSEAADIVIKDYNSKKHRSYE